MSSRDLHIDWLKAFLAIVDTGSVTAAAKQVLRSQSAVSMQLKKLEESVGRPLLVRGARELSLTTAGYDLLGYARQIMDMHNSALAALHDGQVSGRVSLGLPDDYASTYLAPLMRSFTSRFANIETTVYCEQSRTLIEKVERGALDIAIITQDVPGRGQLLFQEQLIWVASEQHEAWKQNPLPVAVHDITRELRGRVLSSITAQDRLYRVVYNSPNVSGQLAVAESGMAVAIITRCSLSGQLKVLDSRNGLPELESLNVVVIRSENARHSPAAIALYEQILRMFRDNE